MDKFYKNMSRMMLMQFVGANMEKNLIVKPANFEKDMQLLPNDDANTKGGMLTKFVYKDEDRYFRRLGFIDCINPNFSGSIVVSINNTYAYVAGGFNQSVISQIDRFFYNYIRFAMVYVDDEQFNAEFITPYLNTTTSTRPAPFKLNDYPVIRANYEKTVQYMLQKYNLDLKQIARDTAAN